MAAIHKIASSSAHGANLSQHDKLTKHSQKLVSQTFFGTLLKQMRNSPFKSKMFDGGRGGEAFSSMLDQHLADRMASGAGHKLVTSMVHHIEKHNPDKTNPPPAAAGNAAWQRQLQKGGYRSMPARDGRKNVPADFRA